MWNRSCHGLKGLDQSVLWTHYKKKYGPEHPYFRVKIPVLAEYACFDWNTWRLCRGEPPKNVKVKNLQLFWPKMTCWSYASNEDQNRSNRGTKTAVDGLRSNRGNRGTVLRFPTLVLSVHTILT